MEQTIVPEIQNSEPTRTPDAAAMALTGDTNADLQAVAKEMGIKVDASGNVEATQPVKAVVETKTEEKVEVPAKFQNPDGTVNVEKLEKSTVNVEGMIAKYKAKEREAQTLQNKVHNPPAPSQAQAQVQSQNLTPLEIQVANDLIADARAYGHELPQGQAIASAKAMIRLQEARLQAEVGSTQDIRQELEDQKRSIELQGVIDSDPWLLTDEAVETLWQLRQDNPFLNKAPKPWEAAYTFYKGRNGHGAQVKTPTPTGLTAKAPATPVGPVTRVQKTVNLGDTQALRAMDLKDLEVLAQKQFPGLRLR